MDIQEMINKMNQEERQERSKTQLTLGDLIDQLREAFGDAPVANLIEAHSYRGYYSDLAFELGSGTRTVSELLNDCIDAIGKEFTGYKGGEFMMDRSTPLWVANYGSCGVKLLSLNYDGTIETAEDEY